jgi:hypothetical protein
MNVDLAMRDDPNNFREPSKRFPACAARLEANRRLGDRTKRWQWIKSPMKKKCVKAKDLRVHYHEFGSGYPLICIHGAGPGASGWSNFKGNVEAFAKKYRVILFDMPQFGKSDKPLIKDQRLTFIADVLDAFMAATGMEKRTSSATPWAARRRSSSPSIIRSESTRW